MSDLCWGDYKSSEVDGALCKPELGGVQGDPIPPTQVQPFRCLVEGLLQGVGPQQDVIHALGLLINVSYQGVVPGGVGVPRGYIPLGCRHVPVPPPGRDKGCEVPILLPQWHRVVAIPRIEDCLSGVAWNSSCLVEGGGAVVGLPGGVGVQGLEVYSPPQGPVLLGAYHHPVAPSYWGPQARGPFPTPPGQRLCPGPA